MRDQVATYLHALAAAQADTTSLLAADKARACKRARRELAAELPSPRLPARRDPSTFVLPPGDDY